jgi:hypothetical protein
MLYSCSAVSANTFSGIKGVSIVTTSSMARVFFNIFIISNRLPFLITAYIDIDIEIVTFIGLYINGVPPT